MTGALVARTGEGDFGILVETRGDVSSSLTLIWGTGTVRGDDSIMYEPLLLGGWSGRDDASPLKPCLWSEIGDTSLSEVRLCETWSEISRFESRLLETCSVRGDTSLFATEVRRSSLSGDESLRILEARLRPDDVATSLSLPETRLWSDRGDASLLQIRLWSELFEARLTFFRTCSVRGDTSIYEARLSPDCGDVDPHLLKTWSPPDGASIM